MNYVAVSQVVSGLVTILTAYIGREATVKVFDAARATLVTEQRPPTNEEIEAVMSQIEADVDA